MYSPQHIWYLRLFLRGVTNLVAVNILYITWLIFDKPRMTPLSVVHGCAITRLSSLVFCFHISLVCNELLAWMYFIRLIISLKPNHLYSHFRMLTVNAHTRKIQVYPFVPLGVHAFVWTHSLSLSHTACELPNTSTYREFMNTLANNGDHNELL